MGRRRKHYDGLSLILILLFFPIAIIIGILKIFLKSSSLHSTNERNNIVFDNEPSIFFEKEPRQEDYLSNFDKIITNPINGAFLVGTLVYICVPNIHISEPLILILLLWLGSTFVSFSKYDKFNKHSALYKEQILRQAKEFWLSMDGWTFEKELAKLFSILGYYAEVTKGSGDGGVDIILRENNEIIYVQCKAYKDQIGPAPVRELYSVMTANNIQRGIVASFIGFTPKAIEFADKNHIELIDLNDIIKIATDSSHNHEMITT